MSEERKIFDPHCSHYIEGRIACRSGHFQTQACKNINVVNCQNCGGYFKQLPSCMKEDAEYSKEWAVRGEL